MALFVSGFRQGAWAALLLHTTHSRSSSRVTVAQNLPDVSPLNRPLFRDPELTPYFMALCMSFRFYLFERERETEVTSGGSLFPMFAWPVSSQGLRWQQRGHEPKARVS